MANKSAKTPDKPTKLMDNYDIALIFALLVIGISAFFYFSFFYNPPNVILNTNQPIFQTPANASLDSFGGYTEMHAPGYYNIFYGTVTSATYNSLTDANANFPTNGVLIGKLIYPAYNKTPTDGYWYKIIGNTKNTIYTDPEDGNMLYSLVYTSPSYSPAKYEIASPFTMQEINNRWFLIDPLGNAYFAKYTDLTADGGNPDILPYTAIFLESNNGTFSSNLAQNATLAHQGGITMKSGYTIKNINDTIYLGSTLPYSGVSTYFLLSQFGVGGRIKWYYSTSSGWAPMNIKGDPSVLIAENGTTIYNYPLSPANNVTYNFNKSYGEGLGPSPDGFYNNYTSAAQYVTWFSTDWGYLGGNPQNLTTPLNFSPVALSSESQPLYYIKGVVVKGFSTPPILSQVLQYIGSSVVIAKYQAPNTNPFNNWAKAVNQQLSELGFDGVGPGSYRYFSNTNQTVGSGTLPYVAGGYFLSNYAMRLYQVKGIYDGQGEGSGVCGGWPGMSADPFDPNFKTAIDNMTSYNYDNLTIPSSAQFNGQQSALYPFFEADEADEMFALSSQTHDNAGMVILMANPYRNVTPSSALYGPLTYSDPHFYAKYALRDFLRYEYRASGDPIAPFALNTSALASTLNSSVLGYDNGFANSGSAATYDQDALQNINKAWGTNYTTWGTSSGNLTKGTNAWINGTGFMDEDGKILHGNCNIAYTQVIDPSHPAVQTDLNSYVTLFTEKYGSIVYTAIKKRTENLVAWESYDTPTPVAVGMRNYTDLVLDSPNNVSDALRIYNVLQKPIVLGDYASANSNSSITFGGNITAISYNSASGLTAITFNGIPYMLRESQPVLFPYSSAFLDTAQCGYLNPSPSPVSITKGYTLMFQGDYETCVKVGQPITLSNGGDPLSVASCGGCVFTQPQRAAYIINYLGSIVNAKGSDGKNFIVGLEHWTYVWAGKFTGEQLANFGIVTSLLNAYDGVQDVSTISKGANGTYTGGETGNYGNMMGILSPYLKCLYSDFANGTNCTSNYTITFTESGLPSGYKWSVTLVQQGYVVLGTHNSTTPTISFSAPPGMYGYIPNAAVYAANALPYGEQLCVSGNCQSTGIIGVVNKSMGVSIPFAIPNYTTTSISTTSTSSTTSTIIPLRSVSLHVSNASIHSGQLETLTANISEGASPYTVNFFNVTGGTAHLAYSLGYQQWFGAANSPAYTQSVTEEQNCFINSNNIYCPTIISGSSSYYAPILSSGSLGSWTATNEIDQYVPSCAMSTYSNNIYCTGVYLGGNLFSGAVTNSPILIHGGLGLAATSANTFPVNIGSDSCVTYSNTATSTNNIYCIGGYKYLNANGSLSLVFNAVYYAPIYASGAIGSWQSTSAYPANIDTEDCVTNSNNIYCIAGYTPAIGVINLVYYAPILSSGSLGSWTSTNSYLLNVESPSCVTSQNYIYCVGGITFDSTHPGAYYAPILSSGSLGSWTSTTSYPGDAYGQNCATYSNNIYCVDGTSFSGSASNAVFYAPLSAQGIASTLNYTFLTNSPTNGKVFKFNVVVTDSESPPVTVNSITNTFTVNTIQLNSTTSTMVQTTTVPTTVSSTTTTTVGTVASTSVASTSSTSTTTAITIVTLPTTTSTPSTSVKTTTVSATTTIIVSNPTVQITSPQSGAVVSGTVNIAIHATDNVAIKNVSIYINNKIRVVLYPIGSANYNYAWSTKGGKPGKQTITAIVYDTSKNSASTSIMVTTKK